MLESTLRDILSSQLSVLENGLELLSTEKYIPSTIGTRSFIDILARDLNGRWVLIELKRSNASAREAIHEIYKYVEAVKAHLRARDDEIRTMIVSTEWKELLIPFSRFVQDTSISISGIKISVTEPDNHLSAEAILPMPLTEGRILSPWHEISLYSSEHRLAEGVISYDTACKAKGIDDYILLEMRAPEGFYEASVLAIASSINARQGGNGNPTEEEIAETAQKMERLEHLLYFVPQLQSVDTYMDIIRADKELYEEVKDYFKDMEGDELLGSLQEYALYADPKIDRDYFEIGYPAKFQNKLIESEGWKIEKIHRRGAFARNQVLSDETIFDEIAGEAGTSGQILKRSISLSDNAELSQLLKDIDKCLPNNSVWVGMIRAQLHEAQTDYPNGKMDVSIFSPSTGMLTPFFAVTKENGIRYVPSYYLSILEHDEPARVYVGELRPISNDPMQPDTFTNVLSKYYNSDLGMLTMSMTWGGYEPRDIDILEHLGLIYSSYRCDFIDNNRKFYRIENHRWRDTSPISPYEEFNSYLERNERLLNIIVWKLSPRIGPGFWEGTSSEMLLQKAIDPVCIKKNKYHIDPPSECDICSVPLDKESFFSDGRVINDAAWANMCADCTIYFGEGVGWGTGQLYRQEKEGRWLLVGGCSDADDDSD